jgi:hypothetical protein
MKWAVASVCAISTIATFVQAGPPSSAEIKRKQAEMKVAHERKAAEIKRKHEQQLRELTSSSRSPLSSSKLFQPSRSAKPVASSFNAALAPPPADCLGAFVAAARSARRMEELLKYMPASQRRSLEEYQATHDPRQAEQNRQWHRKQQPTIDETSLKYLSNPPYVNELNRQRDIAGKIRSVLDVKVDGDRAMLKVSTNNAATINGGKYPYGTATIEMVGEEGFWKMDSYNDGNVFYQEPPTKP